MPDGRACPIVKHGMASGRWSLQDSGVVVAEARKFSPFSRVFSVGEAQGPDSALRADSPFSGRFVLWNGESAMVTIVPQNAFTRAATVGHREDVDTRKALFCFWLAALMWRRAARSA